MSLGVRRLPSGTAATMCGSGSPGDQHRVAIEQPASSRAGGARDLLLAAARQQTAGEAGDRRVARGMGGGEPRLLADARGELAGDQRDDEQHDRP